MLATQKKKTAEICGALKTNIRVFFYYYIIILYTKLNPSRSRSMEAHHN